MYSLIFFKNKFSGGKDKRVFRFVQFKPPALVQLQHSHFFSVHKRQFLNLFNIFNQISKNGKHTFYSFLKRKEKKKSFSRQRFSDCMSPRRRGDLPLHVEQKPPELAAGMALTHCKHKSQPAWTPSKSGYDKAKNSSAIIVCTLSRGRAQTNIGGIRGNMKHVQLRGECTWCRCVTKERTLRWDDAAEASSGRGGLRTLANKREQALWQKASVIRTWFVSHSLFF